MKPANFPGRKERRRLRAVMPKGAKTEPEIDSGTVQQRTKKRRNAKRDAA